MKRFTETTKWRDPWFRRLSPVAKLLWLYITDHCSCIGLIDLDLEAARFDVGQAINEKHLAELGDRVQALGNGKIFVPKFIPFQYGQLSPACPAHKPILKAIEQHRLLTHENGYQYPSDRVAIPFRNGKGKEEEKEKEKKEGVQGEIKDSTAIPESLNVPEFLAAWVRWLDHLKQKRKPPTIHAQDLQLHKLSLMGIPKAIETINHCIEHNWQGIYERNEAAIGNNTPSSRPLTGAEQRTAGHYAPKHDPSELPALLARRQAAKAGTANGVAAPPSGSGSVTEGSSTHG